MEQLPLFENGRRPETDPNKPRPPKPVRPRPRLAPIIPPEVVIAAVELMGGIDLDPYCVDESTTLVPAKHHLGLDAKALKTPWGPKLRRIFLAPPSGRATASWIKKLCEEYETKNISQGIAYLRAALDRDWWEHLTPYPICVVHHQIRVVAGIRRAADPWVVVYLGKNLKGFAEAFSEVGALYVPYRSQTVTAQPEEVKKPAKEKEAPSVQTIRHGDYTLTVHRTASYFTLANPNLAPRDHVKLRAAILDIPGILPPKYSITSKSQDGIVKLVFSFKRGQAETVISRVKNLLTIPLDQMPAPIVKPENLRRKF